VRPTTDRVKEAVFSLLGEAVADALVLDLCCGAGGLGIEALSRGAREAVFVDRDRTALATVRRNLFACGAPPDTWRLATADAVAWLGGPGFAPGDRPWLLLADPPYGTGLATALARLVARQADLGRFRAAVLEHDEDERPAAPGLDVDRRRYGSSRVTVLWPATDNAEEGRP
jgi:16S rRNA (guanine966-N2)-methyltransferase